MDSYRQRQLDQLASQIGTLPESSRILGSILDRAEHQLTPEEKDYVRQRVAGSSRIGGNAEAIRGTPKTAPEAPANSPPQEPYPFPGVPQALPPLPGGNQGDTTLDYVADALRGAWDFNISRMGRQEGPTQAELGGTFTQGVADIFNPPEGSHPANRILKNLFTAPWLRETLDEWGVPGMDLEGMTARAAAAQRGETIPGINPNAPSPELSPEVVGKALQQALGIPQAAAGGAGAGGAGGRVGGFSRNIPMGQVPELPPPVLMGEPAAPDYSAVDPWLQQMQPTAPDTSGDRWAQIAAALGGAAGGMAQMDPLDGIGQMLLGAGAGAVPAWSAERKSQEARTTAYEDALREYAATMADVELGRVDANMALENQRSQIDYENANAERDFLLQQIQMMQPEVLHMGDNGYAIMEVGPDGQRQIKQVNYGSVQGRKSVADALGQNYEDLQGLGYKNDDMFSLLAMQSINNGTAQQLMGEEGWSDFAIRTTSDPMIAQLSGEEKNDYIKRAQINALRQQLMSSPELMQAFIEANGGQF